MCSLLNFCHFFTLQLLQGKQRNAKLIFSGEGLRHLLQPLFGKLKGKIN
jgi:hypothetical protein